MDTPDFVTELALLYDGTPTIRTLAQLIPGGSAVDFALSAGASAIRRKRTRLFFEELALGNAVLSPDLIRGDDFLHCFFSTLNAAQRTHRRQKIRYLAKLLLAAGDFSTAERVDEFEELLAIVETLSYRELLVLAVLAKHERSTPAKTDENPYQRSLRYWPAFEGEVGRLTELAPDLLDSWLLRLPRSGCYELFAGGYMAGPLGGKGKLTPLFYRLEELAGSVADVAV